MLKPLTNEEFIKKARSVHGDTYDYSKVEYSRTHIDVIIICPVHGEFLQSPHNHLIGHGCPMCGFVQRKEKIRGKPRPRRRKKQEDV